MCPTLLHATNKVAYQPAHCIDLSARFVGPDLGNLSADSNSAEKRAEPITDPYIRSVRTALILIDDGALRIN